MIKVWMIAFILNILICGAIIRKFQWNEYLQLSNQTNDSNSKQFTEQLSASDYTGQPVYVSLTTVRARLFSTYTTIKTILNGTTLPTRIYLFVSEAPYIVDQGISKEHLVACGLDTLAQTHAQHFSIIYTNNIGPHRKLLPLLAEKWNEDCVIISIDDHSEYPPDTVSSLLNYYIASGRESVVALRARRIGLCFDNDPWKTAPYPRKGIWPVAVSGRQEMLLLPTGSGGVLYRPKFFAEYVFDENLRNCSRTNDDLTFRLGTIGKGVKVVTACNSMISFQDNGKSLKCPDKPAIRHTITIDISVSTSGVSATSSSTYATELERSSDNNHLRQRNVLIHHDDNEVSTNTSSTLPSVALSPAEPTYPDPWGASLWRINQNAESRNQGSGWSASVQYLQNTSQLNFNQDVLQKYAPLERSTCRIHAMHDGFLGSVANKVGSALIVFGFMNENSTAIGDTKTLIQSAYDHECGIQFCQRHRRQYN